LERAKTTKVVQDNPHQQKVLGYTKNNEEIVNKALDIVADTSIDVEEFKEKMKK